MTNFQEHHDIYLCLAAIQRMWSSKINFADSRGMRLVELEDKGRYMVTCKHRESSLSPVTSISCDKNLNNHIGGWIQISWNMTHMRYKPLLILHITFLNKLSMSQLMVLTCKNATNLVTPHPSLRVSGSTRINWMQSITKKRRTFWPSLFTTVQAMRSLLSGNEMLM